MKIYESIVYAIVIAKARFNFAPFSAILNVLPIRNFFSTVQSSEIFVGLANADTAEDSGEALSLIVTKHNRWLKIV